MTIRRTTSYLLALAALVLAPVSGCFAPESSADPAPAAPSVVSLAVGTSAGAAPVSALFAWQVEGTGPLSCELDLDDDGFAEQLVERCDEVSAASASYAQPGAYFARLTVRDQWGQTSSSRSGVITVASDPAEFPTPEIAMFEVDSGAGFTPQSVVFGWDVIPAGPGAVTCYVDIDGDGLVEHTIADCAGRGSVTSWIHTGGQRTARFAAVAANGAMSTDTAHWSVAAYGLDITSFSATPEGGEGPLDVTFTWEIAADNASPRCALDADGDGTAEYVADPCEAIGSWSHLFLEPGTHAATFSVTDAGGAATQANATVDLANHNPAIRRFVVLPAGPPPSLDVVLVWVAEDADPTDSLECEVDVDGDGDVDFVASECEGSQKVAWSYSVAGNWNPTLIVRDSYGGVSSAVAASIETTEAIGAVVGADIVWRSNGDTTPRSIAWRPDGGALVAVVDSVSGDAAHIWDTATGEALLTLPISLSDTTAVAWSDDGTRVAVASAGGQLVVHDAKTGAPLSEFGNSEHHLTSISWRPDSHQIVSTGTDGITRLWDADAATQLGAFAGHEAAVTGAAWSPTGARIATSSEDRSVRIFDTATFAQVHAFHDASTAVAAISWSADGDHIASVDVDGSVRIYDPMAGVLTSHVQVAGTPRQLAFSPSDDRLAIANEEGDVTFVDTATTSVDAFGPGASAHATFAWQPNSDTFAVGGEGLAVTLFDHKLGNIGSLSAPSGHAGAVRDVAVSPDGGLVASVALDGVLRVASSDDGAVLSVMQTFEDELTSVAWAASGAELYAGGIAGTVSRWDAVSGQMWELFAAHAGPVEAISVAPDGQSLATASADGVKLWAHDGVLLDSLSNTQGALSVAWSPSGEAVAVGRDDGWVGVWSTSTGKLLAIWTADPAAVHAVAWSANGNLVASGGTAGNVSVRNVSSGTWEMAVHTHIGGVYALSFSPWGERIASTGADGRLSVINVESKSVELQTAFGFADEGAACAVAWISPSALVAGHDDTTVAAIELVTE